MLKIVDRSFKKLNINIFNNLKEKMDIMHDWRKFFPGLI